MIKKSARFNYIILIYLAGIAVFTLFRLVETVAYCATTDGPDDFAGLYPRALLMGLRFDTVVSCYMLALPLVMIIVGELARIRKGWYYNIAHYITMVLYTICFFACAADIPYFCYFFNRLDMVALTWADDFGTSASMIVHEPMYLFYLIVFVLITVGWWILGEKLKVKGERLNGPWLPYGWGVSIAVVLLGLGFLGMRGKLSKIPIRVGTAYFCNNPFLNQIGLNPTFTFLKSLEEAGKSANQPIALVDQATMTAVLKEQRAIPADSTLSEASLRLPVGTNVVLVLMESMAYDKTGLSAIANSMTPCLDSLMDRSMTFTEAWSAGIHTHNGICAALYAQPAILARNIMKTAPVPTISGLPQKLHEAGYSTTYFMAHDEDFDGMRGFLYQNGFDRVVGQHSYPRKEIVGTWGIPDHTLFDHVLEHCDSMAAKGPFFTCVMTCSDHGPFIVPEDIPFKSQYKEPYKQTVEYADWSIGRFISMVRQKQWFNNTLFVFIADHGASMNPIYDMDLSYNHVPLLFYAPRKIEGHKVDRLGLQIDVAPTILGLLGINDDNEMLGVNLMTHCRPYAFFSADDKIGVVDGEWFYLYRVKQEGRESLYRYQERSVEDMIGLYPDKASVMRRYGLGMIQAGEGRIRGL